jgi:hypothetical protein
MTVHLVNPSHLSFGVGVITPRWLFVLAGATPPAYGAPRITDETLEPFSIESVRPGDVVGVGIHTGNALRGYEIGTLARARGATVVFGGIHATLYPGEAQTLGGAHAVVRGDGDVVWPVVLDHAAQGSVQPVYEAGRVDADRFVPARWELLPQGRYMWGSVQTVRGCPKHCSFCSVWRTDGQKPRQRGVDAVVDEIVDLRRRGYRFIALADDNFYPVALADLAMAERQHNTARQSCESAGSTHRETVPAPVRRASVTDTRRTGTRRVANTTGQPPHHSAHTWDMPPPPRACCSSPAHDPAEPSSDRRTNRAGSARGSRSHADCDSSLHQCLPPMASSCNESRTRRITFETGLSQAAFGTSEIAPILYLDRDVDRVKHAITSKRLLAGLGRAGARQLRFVIAEEGITAAAYLVLTVAEGPWTIEDAGTAMRPARAGAIFQR